MSKQSILETIISELNRLNVPYQTGGNSDISVSAEFLDAGWSTGNKRITYEASVFADESAGIVYMWEFTREMGSGISFGETGENSFQSGMTLFRKVKSVQYGPEGKVYEYTLDIGAISKAVKQAAKENGWKFKTVLRKEKASYPSGYQDASVYPVQQVRAAENTYQVYCQNCGSKISADSKFCRECGLPVQAPNTFISSETSRMKNGASAAERSADQSAGAEKQAKKSKAAGVLLSASCVLILAFFGIMGMPWLSWILAIGTLTGFFLFSRKAAGNILLTLLLWIIAMAVVFFIFVFTLPDSDSVVGALNMLDPMKRALSTAAALCFFVI